MGALPADGDAGDAPLKRLTTLLAALSWGLAAAPAVAHDGPPYPIVSDAKAGAYELSVWTDPDVTEDGSPGGQFWVLLVAAGGGDAPPETRVRVAVRPLGAAGAGRDADAASSAQNPSRYFAALPLDHEGRWRVEATIDGPLGSARIGAEVEATYDLRPAPGLFFVYLLPFVLVGFLWVKALRRGRRAVAPLPTDMDETGP